MSITGFYAKGAGFGFNGWVREDLPFGFVATEELPGGHCSRVWANERQVLKVPFQGEEMVSGWKAALLLSGNVGPRIDLVDESSGALVMERVRPGLPMGEHWDDAVFIDFVRKLQGLPIADCLRVSAYFDPGLDIPKCESEVFLHGDLHPENILAGEKGWVLIDPKGLRGEPEFEAAAWLRNPISLFEDLGTARAVTLDRLSLFEERLGWRRSRMLLWASLCLSDEGSGQDARWAAARALFDELLRS